LTGLIAGAKMSLQFFCNRILSASKGSWVNAPRCAATVKPDYLDRICSSYSSRAGAGRFFYTKKSTLPCSQERVVLFSKEEATVYYPKRLFMTSTVVFPTIVLSGCGQGSPVQNPAAPTPSNPTPSSSPQPIVPISPNGTFYKGNRAGITGTLEEVLNAAKLKPELNKLGILTKLDGRPAPTVAMYPGGKADNGFYFFHINGKFVGNTAREITLNTGDTWDLFDWKGV
jgi:hypothetical protein